MKLAVLSSSFLLICLIIFGSIAGLNYFLEPTAANGYNKKLAEITALEKKLTTDVGDAYVDIDDYYDDSDTCAANKLDEFLTLGSGREAFAIFNIYFGVVSEKDVFELSDKKAILTTDDPTEIWNKIVNDLKNLGYTFQIINSKEYDSVENNAPRKLIDTRHNDINVFATFTQYSISALDANIYVSIRSTSCYKDHT